MRKDLITTKIIHEMHYRDFENLVKEVFKQYYEFVADQECGNDSSHTFGPFDDDDVEADAIAFFTATGEYNYSAHYLLGELVRLGHLPNGEYLIDVCW